MRDLHSLVVVPGRGVVDLQLIISPLRGYLDTEALYDGPDMAFAWQISRLS